MTAARYATTAPYAKAEIGAFALAFFTCGTCGAEPGGGCKDEASGQVCTSGRVCTAQFRAAAQWMAAHHRELQQRCAFCDAPSDQYDMAAGTSWRRVLICERCAKAAVRQLDSRTFDRVLGGGDAFDRLLAE